MSRLRKILVPVDFSAGSEAAAREAEALARGSGGEIVYLHVIDLKPLMLVDVGGMAPAFDLAPLDESSRKELDVWARRSGALGLNVSQRIERGIPELEIVTAADECQADLIVMGTHGRRGLRHLLVGSVTERVVRTSKVPVLTVRATEAA